MEKNNGYEYAGLSRRFFAYLIDWYIGGLITALPISAISMKLFQTVQNQNIMSFEEPYNLIAGCLALAFGMFYYVIVPAFIWRGQTLAKRWMKIKIAASDGSEAGAGSIWIRQLFGIIIVEGSLITVSTVWHQVAEILTGMNFVKVLMYAGMGISIASAILTLFGRHKAIHDFLGNTVVVKCS